MANAYYKVKILKCSSPTSWYKHLVGKEVKIQGCKFKEHGTLVLSVYEPLHPKPKWRKYPKAFNNKKTIYSRVHIQYFIDPKDIGPAITYVSQKEAPKFIVAKR